MTRSMRRDVYKRQEVAGVPLSEMATLEYTDAAQTIMKMDGKYTVTVSATCLSDDKADIQDAMDEFLNTLDLPDSVGAVSYTHLRYCKDPECFQMLYDPRKG